MKNILLITNRIPYPPIGGDRLKNMNLIKILSKYYNLYVIIVTNEQLDDKSEIFLKEYTKFYKVFRKSKYYFLFNLSKSILNNKPLQVNYYFFKEIIRFIETLVKQEKIDIGISTLVRTTEYLKNLKIPKVFDMADSIGQNYKKSIMKVKSPFWKLIYLIESNRLLAYEKNMINKFDLTFMFNKEEIKFFDNKQIKFLPHGVNEELLKYEKINTKYQNYIAFFGKMDYQPNIDAVLWFLENILNNLHKNLKFIIVGANPTSQILELEKKYSQVEVTGFVEDPYEILQSSLCIVSPMQTGGGIQNKILESMALGTINIVSSLAAKPIGAKNRQDYIVLDSFVEISKEINNIYKNKKKYEYYKINSREFIKDNFTWNIFEKVYISEIERLINDNKN